MTRATFVALLAALSYPNAPRGLYLIPGKQASTPDFVHNTEHLRTGYDLMNVFFLVEAYTDLENAAITKEIVDIVIDALHNPHKIRPEGECIIGEIARQ